MGHPHMGQQPSHLHPGEAAGWHAQQHLQQHHAPVMGPGWHAHGLNPGQAEPGGWSQNAAFPGASRWPH